MDKIITYVLTVSEVFPKKHILEGYPTNFVKQINERTKKHTICGNYKLWEKRFKKISEGKACLSIRYWSGKPYNSKQVEITKLHCCNGIRLQKLEFIESLAMFSDFVLVDGELVERETIAKNDGLSIECFDSWFKNADNEKEYALIHFTGFKY